jgi:hypothetical protein
MMHRAHIEPGQAQRQAGRQCDRHEGADARARHFGEP